MQIRTVYWSLTLAAGSQCWTRPVQVCYWSWNVFYRYRDAVPYHSRQCDTSYAIDRRAVSAYICRRSFVDRLTLLAGPRWISLVLSQLTFFHIWDPVRVLTCYLATYRFFLIRIFPLFDNCTINLPNVDRQSLWRSRTFSSESTGSRVLLQWAVGLQQQHAAA